MDPEKMSKSLLMAVIGIFILLFGLALAGETLEGKTPISEMTVEQLFVIVIVAALLMGR